VTSNKDYAVGKGRPPVHSRFKKGQSGNPSGKPGPKKAMRAQLRDALRDALESDTVELRMSEPPNAIGEVVKSLVIAAMQGEKSSTRLLLSLVEKSEPADAPRAAGAANDGAELSLPQGKTQGRFENDSVAPAEGEVAPDVSPVRQACAGNEPAKIEPALDAPPAPPEPPPYVREKRPTIMIAGQIVQQGD
jgi:hypothetical protein